jgi:predicted nucleic acid-binding Zn ribbon protein
MEPAGKLLSKLKLPGGCVATEELVRATWTRAVGKRLASHARAVAVVRQRLVVEVDDAIWQNQLKTMADQILQKLNGLLAGKAVSQIEFRVALPRREPQRAVTGRVSLDEADGIRDSSLRRVYRMSRQRSLLA